MFDADADVWTACVGGAVRALELDALRPGAGRLAGLDVAVRTQPIWTRHALPRSLDTALGNDKCQRRKLIYKEYLFCKSIKHI